MGEPYQLGFGMTMDQVRRLLRGWTETLPAAFLFWALATVFVVRVAGCGRRDAAESARPLPTTRPTSRASAVAALSHDDEAFLDDLERRGVAYFLDQAEPGTGLVADRAKSDGRRI